MKTTQLTVLLAGGLALPLTAATPIAEWSFDGGSTSPSLGAGSASLIGGTTGSFDTGNLGGLSWSTTSYPVQGAANGTAGVQFNVSTIGFDFIEVSYEHLASATASRWSEFQYTLDASAASPEWVSFANNGGDLSPQDTFTSQSFDLSGVDGVGDNPNFAFRIVSVFSPVAFNPGVPVNEYGAFTAYHRSHADSLNGDAYGSSGVWAFDNIYVGSLSSVMVPEPATAGLLCIGGAWFALRSMKSGRRTGRS